MPELNEIRGLDHQRHGFHHIYVYYPEYPGITLDVVPASRSLAGLIRRWQDERRKLLERVQPIGGISRPQLTGKMVWVRYGHEFNPMPTATMGAHSSASSQRHLGDCWLVYFEGGGSAFIPSNMIYMEQL